MESITEKEYYRKKIIEMVGKINNVDFLYKIYIILMLHIEKGRD